MTAVTEAAHDAVTPSTVGRSPWPRRLGLVALVAVVASPLVVASLAIAGEPWWPMGDWASMAWRTSQVGTADTPLVGAYTVKGWAHPGPLLFWLAAPLFRLSGGDARTLEWTAAIINTAAIAAVAAVAWRRGRWALTLALMLLTAVLVHGFGPDLMVDVWNPHAPLLAFLLTVVLVWDAALGRRRALLEAAVPACFAMQCHLAFVPLVALLALWVWAWCRWWPRLLPQDEAHTAELPRPPWARWWRIGGWAAGVVALLSVGPLIDSVLFMHNPLRILYSFGGDTPRLGLVNAVGVVGRYVRPDGPWMGGETPLDPSFQVQGSGPLPLLAALAVLAWCLRVGRRRGLVDVVALSCLALTLVVGAVPAASQFVVPAEPYLAQWIKVVGGLVWFTVAWTGWRVAEPWVRAVPRRRAGAAALATVAVVAAAGWSWGAAGEVEARFGQQGEAMRRLGVELAAELPKDQVIRVEHRGEPWHIWGPSLIYALLDEGVNVITSDGQSGVKWGRDHIYDAGDDYDMLLTIAVHNGGSWSDAYARCDQGSSTARLLGSWDAITPEERAFVDDMRLRQLDDPASISAEERARFDRLELEGTRVGVFEGPQVCGLTVSLLPKDDD
jgi:hypothetical protein